MTVLIVNPPSPKGCVVNREGFGGLGTLIPSRRGFVYPAQMLAEAAGALGAARIPFRSADCVLNPILGPSRIFRRLPVLDGGHHLIMAVSAVAFDHDLRFFSENFAAQRLPIVIPGMGLEPLHDELTQRVPSARVVPAIHGGQLVDALLGRKLGPSTSWPDADWRSLPLGRTRRLPLYHGRGCNLHCTYCPYVKRTAGHHYVRSAEETLAEWQRQVRAHRPKRVVFRDPVFGFDRASTLQLLRSLAKFEGKARPPFEIESRAELLDDELLAALTASGCAEIKLGIETLDTRKLLMTNRVDSPESATRYVAEVHRVLEFADTKNIAVRPFFLEGLPGSGTPTTPLPFALESRPNKVVRRVLPPDAAKIRETHLGGAR